MSRHNYKTLTDEEKTFISSNVFESLKFEQTDLSKEDLKFILSQNTQELIFFFHKGVEECYSYNSNIKSFRMYRSYPAGEFDQTPVPDFYRTDLGLILRFYPNIERIVLPYIDKVSDIQDYKKLKSIDVMEHESLSLEKMRFINDHFPNLERFHVNQCNGKAGAILLFTPDQLKMLVEDNKITCLYVPNRYQSYHLLRNISLIERLCQVRNDYEVSLARSINCDEKIKFDFDVVVSWVDSREKLLSMYAVWSILTESQKTQYKNAIVDQKQALKLIKKGVKPVFVSLGHDETVENELLNNKLVLLLERQPDITIFDHPSHFVWIGTGVNSIFEKRENVSFVWFVGTLSSVVWKCFRKEPLPFLFRLANNEDQENVKSFLDNIQEHISDIKSIDETVKGGIELLESLDKKFSQRK